MLGFAALACAFLVLVRSMLYSALILVFWEQWVWMNPSSVRLLRQVLVCAVGSSYMLPLQGEEAVRHAYRHEDLAYYIIRPGGLTNQLGGILGLSIEQGPDSPSHFLSAFQKVIFAHCRPPSSVQLPS